ncbi:uncharacterized protein BO97DRAFT_408866 [Aspergillus homomorphus CBS 101889]|uniref:Phosphomevalonate dehydratase large subunit-like domain-containing protein n=1 Tax=Aspergillus homomorphus (strain CBS 101889) TaxID=1450537 RepID=A0A395HIQ5_ASPHC|nr:hypothetical protein BO97DRAFT_408866 [Aspergillus homomorphus CBS 101889]RAL07650.1 hypothetical protein BO97DRAFT_408866 [Aspergillus homomorphus CBS 101889]
MHSDTLIVACHRETQARVYHRLGHVAVIEQSGAQIFTDTSWCMIQEPVIPQHVGSDPTKSVSYAYYGTELTGVRRMRFGSLAECVDAACWRALQHGSRTKSFGLTMTAIKCMRMIRPRICAGEGLQASGCLKPFTLAELFRPTVWLSTVIFHFFFAKVIVSVIFVGSEKF